MFLLGKGNGWIALGEKDGATARARSSHTRESRGSLSHPHARRRQERRDAHRSNQQENPPPFLRFSQKRVENQRGDVRGEGVKITGTTVALRVAAPPVKEEAVHAMVQGRSCGVCRGALGPLTHPISLRPILTEAERKSQSNLPTPSGTSSFGYRFDVAEIR